MNVDFKIQNSILIFYSYLNASAGSIREAFLAGKPPEIIPIIKVKNKTTKKPKKSREAREKSPLIPKLAAANPIK